MIRQRGGRRVGVAPELTPVGDDRIIASTRWIGDDRATEERFQVFTFRDGEIVDLQGCATRREAERFARRRKRR